MPVSEDAFVLGYILTDDEDVVKKALDSLPEFIEESKLKVSDVDYFIPIYYDAEKGWHFPPVPDKDQE